MRIAYVVPDINDAAVARRVETLHCGGASVTVAGFRRDDIVRTDVDGAPTTDLGRTIDLNLKQRVVAVVRNLLNPRKLDESADAPQLVIGRNLEGLALAIKLRRRYPNAKLIYECLDIHRTLLGSSPKDKAVQFIEGKLLKSVDLVIVSSPAFRREYFARRPSLSAPVELVENKVLALDQPPEPIAQMQPAPPWTIGCFGNLRDRKSFDLLCQLARKMDGKVKVLFAGRPTWPIFTDIAAEIAEAPHVEFLGGFKPGDLHSLYSQCHFSWAIDYFEEGLNSSWLLPNRMYDALTFGAVPISLNTLETGRWLMERGVGMIVENPVAENVAAKLEALNLADYTTMRAAVTALPRQSLILDRAECDRLITMLASA